MIDHKIGKIFGTFFWLGFLVVLVSFFYQRWFAISSGLGVALMVMGLVREGIKLRDGTDTFTKLIKRNKQRMLYRVVLTAVIIAAVIYGMYAKLYDVKIQFFNLTSSPIMLNWWVFVLLGLVLGILLLVIFVKFNRSFGKEPSKEKPEKQAKKKVFFAKIKEKISALFSKRHKAEHKEKKVEKAKPEKKRNIHIYKFVTIMAFFLSMVALSILLVLNRRAKLPFLYWYSWITMFVLAAVFVLLILLKVYSNYHKRHIEEKKEEVDTVNVIKKAVVARANKYKTDIDKLYELVNQKGKLTLTEVSKGFGIKKELAEQWAKVLEDHDLIRLNYPPFGELELCKK